MPLTSAQLATLKAGIVADPALNVFPNTSDGNFDLAAKLKETATPDFWVWKSRVGKGELVQTIGPDGTTFNWTGNGFITRTAGEQTAWREIFNGSGECDPSLANVRQAFADIFSGTGNAAANRTHLLAVARRKANRLEKIMATGTGSTGSPAVMGVEGIITGQDVEAARNLP
jgi:hypothetical protein